MTEKDPPRKSFLASRLMWAGSAAAIVGLAFNLGLFFIPLDVWLEDPGFVPLPEVIIGWWVIAIGVLMMAWSLRGRTSRSVRPARPLDKASKDQ